MKLFELLSFCDYLQKEWSVVIDLMTPKRIEEAFSESFSNQQSKLVSYHRMLWSAFERGAEFEDDWLNEWLTEMSGIGKGPWPILESYVHMTNNRLGILNRDEAYLGYVMKRSIEELTKHEK